MWPQGTTLHGWGQCPSLCLPAVFPVRTSHTVLHDPLSVPLPPVSFSTELIPTMAKMLFLQVRSPQSCSGFKHPKTPLHGHKIVRHLNPSPATTRHRSPRCDSPQELQIRASFSVPPLPWYLPHSGGNVTSMDSAHSC